MAQRCPGPEPLPSGGVVHGLTACRQGRAADRQALLGSMHCSARRHVRGPLSRPPQPTAALTKVSIQLPERGDQLSLLLHRLLRGGRLDEAGKLGQDVQAAAMQG